MSKLSKNLPKLDNNVIGFRTLQISQNSIEIKLNYKCLKGE